MIKCGWSSSLLSVLDHVPIFAVFMRENSFDLDASGDTHVQRANTSQRICSIGATMRFHFIALPELASRVPDLCITYGQPPYHFGSSNHHQAAAVRGTALVEVKPK
jgi:hypothetical protein